MKVLLRIFGLLAACLIWTLATSAQSSESKYVVSTRELSIPTKAAQAFAQGVKRLNENDPAGSLPRFQHAIALFPSYYEAYYDMGLADLRLTHVADAERAFRISVDLSGGRFAQGPLLLGGVLDYETKFAEAEEFIRAGLDLAPTDATGQYYLAWALFALHRWEEAEESAREALRLRTDFPEAARLLASIHDHGKNCCALVEDPDEYPKLDATGPTAKNSIRATPAVNP